MFDKKNHNIMFQRSKGNEIIVSVLCLTYNQVLYVRDCLNGFVMQKQILRLKLLFMMMLQLMVRKKLSKNMLIGIPI